MTDTELLLKLWPVFTWLATITGVMIVFAMRQEGRVNHIEKIQETEGVRIAKAIETMSETQSKMAESLSDMRATLSGIVGYERGKEEAAERGRK